MLIKLKKIKSSKKKLLKNWGALSFLQVSNYLFPLITLPYIVRVLGPEKYGLVNFTMAFVAFFNLITDYGFNVSATRELSIYRNNKEKISSIISSIYFIKIILLAISFIIFFTLLLLVPFFNKNFDAYLVAFTIVIGNTFFPLWFFQGIEEMKYITFLNFQGKLFFVILIFLLIKSPADFLLLILFNGLTPVVMCIGAVIIMKQKFGLTLSFPNRNEVLDQFKKGRYILLSNLGISIYTNASTFILGLFSTNEVVGYYSAAEKILNAIKSIMAPIFQTLYPRQCC